MEIEEVNNPAQGEHVEMIDASEEDSTMEIQSGFEEWRVAKEAFHIDELDLHIIDDKPQTTLMEELESFEMGLHDFPKPLEVGKSLPPGLKEKLKKFLQNNLDIFVWKHEDMVGIDPKTSCHHLKIDPKTNPHRKKRRA